MTLDTTRAPMTVDTVLMTLDDGVRTPLEFETDPQLTEQLRAEIVACWTDVSNAGGAVGFVPGVSMDDVEPIAREQFAGVLAGRDRLVIGRVAAGNTRAGWPRSPSSSPTASPSPRTGRPSSASWCTPTSRAPASATG